MEENFTNFNQSVASIYATCFGSLSIGILFNFENEFLLIMAFLSQCMNFAFLKTVWKSGGNFPTTMKSLLILCQIFFTIKSSYLFLRSLIYHHILAFLKPTGVLIKCKLCILIEAIYALSSYAGLVTIFVIALDRFICTVYITLYGRQQIFSSRYFH